MLLLSDISTYLYVERITIYQNIVQQQVWRSLSCNYPFTSVKNQIYAVQG